MFQELYKYFRIIIMFNLTQIIVLFLFLLHIWGTHVKQILLSHTASKWRKATWICIHLTSN